jgi:hypothetical protein
MENSMSTADFEKALITTLTADNFDKKQLSVLSKSVASLGNSAYIIDWRWKGRPGFLDLIKVNYQVPVAEFKADQFFKSNAAREFRIIWKGIPVPRFVEIEAIVRNSNQEF